jgi:dihydroorotate dehydrogenase electron transfer subunit
MLAGGIGIAPLTFLAQREVSHGQSVRLLMGAVTAGQLCPRDMISGQAELICATDDGTFGEKGFITDLLPGHVDWADQVFVCGPAPMYHTMVDRCWQILENKPVQVSLEMRMGCGIGICYSCTIKTKNGLKQVCKDGPVFGLDEVLWDEFEH